MTNEIVQKHQTQPREEVLEVSMDLASEALDTNNVERIARCIEEYLLMPAYDRDGLVGALVDALTEHPDVGIEVIREWAEKAVLEGSSALEHEAELLIAERVADRRLLEEEIKS